MPAYLAYVLANRAAAVAAGVVILALALIGAASAQSASDYRKPAAPEAAATTTAPAGGERQVFVATVHLDGNGNAQGDAKHPPEAFPAAALPAGGGLSLTPPTDDGAWRIRAFVFQPAQVVVFQGAPVTLNFVGVQGPSHRIQVDGRAEIIEVKRGEVKSVEVPAETPGVIGFRSLDRMPSMQGSIVVLPRP